jgi:hypothetical protein
MKSSLRSCLAGVLFLIGASAQAFEPFVLLDDFSGDRIDKNIWDGTRRPEADVLDFAREVTGGQLRLMSRSYADSAPPGQRSATAVRLSLPNSAAITQMLALVRVNAVEMNSCTASAVASDIRGRLQGAFFTTGGPPAPADASRNVFAELRVRRNSTQSDPPGVMQVAARVFQCTDAACNSVNTLFFDTTSLGTITPGQSTLLALVWDPDNDRFLFARDSVAQLTVYNYNGILTDTNPPSSDLSSVNGDIENCVTGPPASGFMDLSIDKIWVNQSGVGPPTAFRFSTLALRDPHVFLQVPVFGCVDFTDTAPLGLTSLNELINDTISDLLVIFRPLVQAGPGGTMEFGEGLCSGGSCSGGGKLLQTTSFSNVSAGTCLAPIPNTTGGFSPPVTNTTAPPTCFVSGVFSQPLSLFPPLGAVQVAANYVGDPATALTDGLIRGFISEQVANQNFIDLGALGSFPLSTFLPGGTNNCFDNDPSLRDIGPDNVTQGWWFYFHFTADAVPFSKP